MHIVVLTPDKAHYFIIGQRSVMQLPKKRTQSIYILRVFFLVIAGMAVVMMPLSDLKAQCTTTISQVIPDDGILTVDFHVSGLIDNDLASPTQGICGVEIDFMHEYLGDLTVSLISPSGTNVQLIGPTTTATTPTNLSRWNIQFVPCASPAAPDAGFSDIWSNLQPWQALTPYSGMYHPNSGCLEDFSAGSANGVWQILFEDHDVFQTGSVASVTLIFCNPAGLSCVECDPNGGILSPASMILCEEETLQSSGVSIDFGINTPSPELYSYTYLLLSGNTIVHSGSPFTFNPIPGNYSYCGLSYLTNDSAQVNNILSGGDFNNLMQSISNEDICANLSTQCANVAVIPKLDTIIIDHILCSGESFSFGGQVYSAPGSYYQLRNGPGSCDTIYNLNITQSQLLVQIPQPDSLSCETPDIVLFSVVTGNSGMVTYEWSTQTGNIIGPHNLSTITVNQPSQYILTIEDDLCSVTSSVNILSEEDFPVVFLNDEIINCFTPTVDLNPVYIPTDGLVTWTGPMGFSSDKDSISVNVPGIYTFSVMDENGCSTRKSINVTIDTVTHGYDIIIVDKNCNQPNVTLGITDNSSISTWNWSDPNNNTHNGHIITVNTPGIYTLTTIFNNGCQRSSSFYFDGDFSLPDISGSSSDTLNCNETIPLFLSSTTPGVTYSWTGPNGFFSSQSSIIANQVGTYLGKILAPNGCEVNLPVEIYKGDDIFNYSTFTDTLNCKTDTVQIGIIAPEADLFFWSNFPGSDSLNSSILVTMAGGYDVMIVDTNSGCSVNAKILVQADYTYPHFRYTTDTITCDNPVAELQFVPLPGYVYSEIFWKLPDQSIVQGPVLHSNLPGEHQLIGISNIGCVGIWIIHIPFDTIKPVFYLESDTLDCNLQETIKTIMFDSLNNILWTGPGMFSSSEFNPMIIDTGIYSAIGYGDNGCNKEVSITVHGDFKQPEGFLSLDELTCLDTTSEFVIHSNDEILSYEWRDEMGSIISTDSIVIVSTPGNYTLKLEGENHCINIDSIVLGPAEYPIVSVSADTLKCDVDSVLIVALADVSDPMFAWLNENGDTLSRVEQLLTDYAGPFIVSVTAPNGCEVKDTLIIPVDTANAIAILNLIGEVRCQNRDFILDGSASQPANIDFQWGTIGGMILSVDTIPAINASDTGIYFLSVTNPSNGCTSSDTIHVMDHPDAITLAYLDIRRPECSGDANGSITISGLEGGVGALLYQLDSLQPQSINSFQGLTAGDFFLEISDSAGCRYDTLIRIEPTNPYLVDAGPDQEIFIGESADLSGITDILPEEVFSQDWDSMGVILCQDCLSSSVTPLKTTTYRFSVESTTGCMIDDEMTVYVIEKGKFFIPNIFSPNGDDVNDELRFYPSPGITRVLNWVIYDRWGNAVFGKSDFIPGDPLVYWDGTSQGSENLNPGVYPYIAEIELINGNRETHHGSITLIR